MVGSVFIYNYSTEVPFQIAPGSDARERIRDLIRQIGNFYDANTKHQISTANDNWVLLDTNRVTLIAPQHVNNLVPGLPKPKRYSSEESRYAVVPLELCKPHSWSILADFLGTLGVKLPDGPLKLLPSRNICMEQEYRYYTLWLRDFTLPWDVAVYSGGNNPAGSRFSMIIKWLFEQESGFSERKVHPLSLPNSLRETRAQVTVEALDWAVVDLGSGMRLDGIIIKDLSGFKPTLIHRVTIDNNRDCLTNDMYYLVLPFTHSTPMLAKMLSETVLQKGLNGWKDYLIGDQTAKPVQKDRELYKVLD